MSKRWLAMPPTLVAVAAGAIAWRSHADIPFAPAPVPPPEAVAAAAPDLALPTATAGVLDHHPGATSVVVTRRALLLAGDPVPLATFPDSLAALARTGIPRRFGRDDPPDFHLPELANGLVFRREQAEAGGGAPTIALLADASTPYRVVAEIVSTATDSGYTAVDLAVRAPGGALAWFGLPELWSGPFSRTDFVPDVYLGAAGVSIHVHRGWDARNVAPGCGELGPGIAVAAAEGGPGLTACLRRLKKVTDALVQEEERLTLHVPPAMAWQDVVATIDAIETATEGNVPFPFVSFATRKGLPALDEGPPPLPPVRRFLQGPPPPQPRELPPGSASIGGAAVSGGEVANAAGAVAGMTAGFRRCYRKGLASSPKMQGSIRVTATIGPGGEVLGVTSTGQGLSETVAMCVRARVASAQFTPPVGGGATIVFPVVFVRD